MNLVWKLLRQHISIPQFVGFFFANLVGMTIIMLGIQFYTDTQAIYETEDSFMKADYLIINKKISSMTTITGKSSAFTRPEVQDLESQEFVERLGMFTSSAYDVKASFRLDEKTSFSTEMSRATNGITSRVVTRCLSSCHETISTSITSVMRKVATCRNCQKES